jgi:hypothetical protein
MQIANQTGISVMVVKKLVLSLVSLSLLFQEISLLKQCCWLVECSLLLKHQHLCWKLCSIVIHAAIVLPHLSMRHQYARSSNNHLRQGLLAWDLAPAFNKKLGLEPQGCEQAAVCILSFSLSLCILCDLKKVTLTLEGFRFCHYLCWV